MKKCKTFNKPKLLALGVSASALMWIVVARSYDGFAPDSAEAATLVEPNTSSIELSIEEVRAVRTELERSGRASGVTRDPFSTP